MPRNRRMTFLVLALGGCLALVVAGRVAIRTFVADSAVERLGWIKTQVRSEFPDAPQLSTDELAERLAAGEDIVLLDVREDDEYRVSHLPGAVRVDPDAPPALPPGIDPSRPVVAYCSVGWRSSRWVEGLRAQGVDAENLEGSIFQWVAEDRPLERDGAPVDVVHPYSRPWAWLVDEEDRAFAPSEIFEGNVLFTDGFETGDVAAWSGPL